MLFFLPFEDILFLVKKAVVKYYLEENIFHSFYLLLQFSPYCDKPTSDFLGICVV